jgi:hypothetical protein
MNPCGAEAWVDFDFVGPEANPLGVGVAVTIEAGGRRRTREVYGLRAVGQGPSRLHFGLGDVETVDRVEIRWPDGDLQVADDVPVRRLLTVTHRSRLP